VSDQPTNQPRSLSEISHLFLSSVRERQTQGAPRPMRVPPSQSSSPSSMPQRRDLTIDLTPEEFDQVFGEREQTSAQSGPSIGPVRAVLASHLGSQQLARVQQYAAHICPQGKRVGLICVDASEFRLSIFEHNPDPHVAKPDPCDLATFHPQVGCAELESTLNDLVGEADLVVELERARLDADGARGGAGLGHLVDDTHSHAESCKP